jgi:hypothetical protein
MFGRIATLHGSTPFNRRVAIAYDTTASGRYLLKWASDTILEPIDNVFVVRAVPKVSWHARRPELLLLCWFGWLICVAAGDTLMAWHVLHAV